MAQTHARSGQIVDVRPLGERLLEHKTSAIIKAEQLEVVRVVLAAGKTMREHRAPGEVTVQCLEGRIEVQIAEGLRVLGPGDFVLLQRHEPHALHATMDSSALVTMCIAKPA